MYIFGSIPFFLFAFSKVTPKEFIDKNRKIILYVTTIVYTFQRIFKTFDVTDTGFHLSKAWGLLTNTTYENSDFLIGTSFIYGLWLKIINTPSVLWGRVGYVIVVSMIIMFSYKIYEIYFKKLTHFFIFYFMIFFFIQYNYYLSVNYDNLPYLFSIIGFYFFLKYPSKIKAEIVAGFFWGFCIFLKFNYIPILILPLVIFALDSKNNKKPVKTLGNIYLGYLLSFGLAFLIMFQLNSINPYFTYVKENLSKPEIKSDEYHKVYDQIINFKKDKESSSVGNISSDSFFYLTDSLKQDSLRCDPIYKSENDNYVVSKLFKIYFTNLWKLIHRSIPYIFFFTVILWIITSKISGIVTRSVFSFISTFFIYFLSHYNLEINLEFLVSILILVSLFYVLILHSIKDGVKKLIIVTTMLALFSFPGSLLSFNIICRAGSALLLLSIPLAILVDERKYTVNKNITLNFSYFTIIVVSFIVFSSLNPKNYNNSHRDLSDRSLLINMFSAKGLYGIHTFPQRVEVVDDFLRFFEKENYERNNTPGVFIGWIPMFYYLTEINCITNNPWHDCLTFTSFRKEFDKNSQKKKPVYIVFSSKFTRNPNWPLADESYKKKDKVWLGYLRKEDYLRFWMKDKSYNLVFENSMFQVFKLEKVIDNG
ncbi:MAG: hypothetical protein CR982_05810 [Candidatus Cloacimonadota bacterium]|nr:MAG: hypothetical protein CR982_05810 [Candidatus Cloacimonadota bacterium]